MPNIRIIEPNITDEENEMRWNFLNDLIWKILERQSQSIDKPA
jgi:hypothetical protein